MQENDIKIELTISMGDICSNTMSIDEARALYESLYNIFGNKISTSYPVIPKTQNNGQVFAKSVPQEFNEQVPKTESLIEKYTKLLAEKQNELDMLREKIPTYNNKVEAARERAAQRTSGCSSRK